MLLLAWGFSVPAAEAQSSPRAGTAKKAVAAAAKKAVAAKPLKLTPGKRATVARTAQRSAARPKSASKQPIAAAAPRAVRASVKHQRTAMGRWRRDAAPAAVVIEPVPLTAIQRETIYRSIVQTPLQPNPVTTERVLPPTADDAPVTPPATAPVPVAANAELTVGAQVPPTVALHPIPEEAIAAVPAIAPYRYAFVGERVFLVDPATGIVVSAINQ